METIVGGPIRWQIQATRFPNFDPYGDYLCVAQAVELMKAEEADVFGAEYDQHMMNLYHSLSFEQQRRMFDPLFLDNGRDN